MQISKYIDHTLLKATATKKDIIKLCREALEYNFYAVCVNGAYVALAKQELINSECENSSSNWFSFGSNDN